MKFEAESITSRKNQRIIHACALAEKKFRDSEGLFALEGKKLFSEALAENIEIREVYFTEKASESFEELLTEAHRRGAKLFCVTDEVYSKLTYEKASQGIFAVAVKKSIPVLDSAKSCDGFIILESLRDPSNVGAILRTCAALGCPRVLLTSDCADVYAYKTLRAAMGAVFKAELYYTDSIGNAIELLRKNGRVYAAALTDTALSIAETPLAAGDSIVIGNEGHGVSELVLEKCDGAVIIPMQCGTESLNASVAAAILIWEKAVRTGRVYSPERNLQ